MSESELQDKAAALTAAIQFHAAADRLQDAIAQAKALVEQTQAQSPLWGDDEAGRRYRANYAPTEELLKATHKVTELLDGLAKVSASAVDTLIDADDQAARVLPD